MNLDESITTDDYRIEWSDTYKGYVAREKWAKRYDELNGAPEDDGDR